MASPASMKGVPFARRVSEVKHPVLHDRWLQLDELGKGTFAKLYRGVDLCAVDAMRRIPAPRSAYVALKFQEMDNNLINTMHMENDVLEAMGGRSAPGKRDFFLLDGEQHVLVMDLLSGLDIARLRTRALDYFDVDLLPLEVALQLAREMLRCLRELHDRGFVHRDVKPNNFVQSDFGADTFHIIDFGIARPYVEDLAHATGPKRVLRPEALKNLERRGTTMYNSVHLWNGKDHCRRDDLISLWYVLLDMLSASPLPWAMAAKSKDRDHVANLKQRLHEKTAEVLDELGVAPSLRAAYAASLRRIYDLGFTDDPPYDELAGYIDQLWASASEGERRGSSRVEVSSWDWARADGEKLVAPLVVFGEQRGVTRWLLSCLQLTSENPIVQTHVEGYNDAVFAAAFVRAAEGLRTHGARVFKGARLRQFLSALRAAVQKRGDFFAYNPSAYAGSPTFREVQTHLWQLDTALRPELKALDTSDILRPKIRAFNAADAADAGAKRRRMGAD
mmetsp:Transcript_38663/g.121098  ORF Transcript_38663/g.121098 Transcript_38663/m.121098 type:complete len:505 (-) Transcript_38663:186-1700(-)|eukprot:CAMPEP_0118860108 /NCGR_PEP_ID=MMETSP1163-20130328/6077_1 /TAXON_ID=124430 /ORGANISM="Phaeomonas parva, Strain CCMP2877" /LENGTH=504 /DNA_ID=CAMNT_0006793765 /DNA_START=254 /DNA_END=1768 /DNA_ORIENTATION=+